MLPKIETPTYQLSLPSSGKKIKFRPFLVKEQKSLLIAMESPEDNAIASTIISIVQACLFNKVDVSTLPKVDVDYIFIKLREKSVGEVVDLFVKCASCGAENEYALDISKAEITKNEDHKNNIKITDTVGLVMRLPTFEEVNILASDYTVENIAITIAGCIEQIYDGDAVYMTKDMEIDTLLDWIGDLNQNQYDKLEEFFSTAPTVRQEIEFKCRECGYDNKLILEGLDDFFG